MCNCSIFPFFLSVSSRKITFLNFIFTFLLWFHLKSLYLFWVNEGLLPLKKNISSEIILINATISNMVSQLIVRKQRDVLSSLTYTLIFYPPIPSFHSRFFPFSNPRSRKMFGFRCFVFKLKIVGHIRSLIFSFYSFLSLPSMRHIFSSFVFLK